MFLKIEGDRLINLTLMSRVELYHQPHKRFAVLYNQTVLEAESHMAYQYFMQNMDNPDVIRTIVLFDDLAPVAVV